MMAKLAYFGEPACSCLFVMFDRPDNSNVAMYSMAGLAEVHAKTQHATRTNTRSILLFHRLRCLLCRMVCRSAIRPFLAVLSSLRMCCVLYPLL